MKPTKTLHDEGQSLWLDNITRDLLEGGTPKRYVAGLSGPGLTPHRPIFDHAVTESPAYDALLRGIERRLAVDLEPEVGSVASVFISRWDAAVAGRVPEALRNQLGIAIAKRTYKTYRTLLDSRRWQRVLNAGARPQRLLWASTGTKDPGASDILYVKALAAPFTVNTMPAGTFKALAEHGALARLLTADGGDSETVLARFAEAGIDVDALATQLQDEGAKSFVNSWRDLMDVIASKSASLEKAS